MKRQANAEWRSWARVRDERGQSLVESCFVIILLCLIFFGFLQVGILYNHERALQFASFAAARSATVGFQQDIYERAYQIAAVAASGKMLRPYTDQRPKAQLSTEIAGLPSTSLFGRYLGRDPTADLDYDYWERDSYQMKANILTGTPSGRMLRESSMHEQPLDMPLAAAFYPSDSRGNVVITMRGQPDDHTDIAWHYEHYLQ